MFSKEIYNVLKNNNNFKIFYNINDFIKLNTNLFFILKDNNEIKINTYPFIEINEKKLNFFEPITKIIGDFKNNLKRDVIVNKLNNYFLFSIFFEKDNYFDYIILIKENEFNLNKNPKILFSFNFKIYKDYFLNLFEFLNNNLILNEKSNFYSNTAIKLNNLNIFNFKIYKKQNYDEDFLSVEKYFLENNLIPLNIFNFAIKTNINFDSENINNYKILLLKEEEVNELNIDFSSINTFNNFKIDDFINNKINDEKIYLKINNFDNYLNYENKKIYFMSNSEKLFDFENLGNNLIYIDCKNLINFENFLISKIETFNFEKTYNNLKLYFDRRVFSDGDQIYFYKKNKEFDEYFRFYFFDDKHNNIIFNKFFETFDSGLIFDSKNINIIRENNEYFINAKINKNIKLNLFDRLKVKYKNKFYNFIITDIFENKNEKIIKLFIGNNNFLNITDNEYLIFYRNKIKNKIIFLNKNISNLKEILVNKIKELYDFIFIDAIKINEDIYLKLENYLLENIKLGVILTNKINYYDFKVNDIDFDNITKTKNHQVFNEIEFFGKSANTDYLFLVNKNFEDFFDENENYILNFDDYYFLIKKFKIFNKEVITNNLLINNEIIEDKKIIFTQKLDNLTFSKRNNKYYGLLKKFNKLFLKKFLIL